MPVFCCGRPGHSNAFCAMPCAMPQHSDRFLPIWGINPNTGRPHMALGLGVPDPPIALREQRKAHSRYRCEESYAVHAKPTLGGLHNEYSLAFAAA